MLLEKFAYKATTKKAQKRGGGEKKQTNNVVNFTDLLCDTVAEM